MPYVITRNNNKHFKRRIPTKYKEYYPKSLEFVTMSLCTDSERIAQERALTLNTELEKFWEESFNNKNDDFSVGTNALIDKTRRLGFRYKQVHEIAESEIVEIVNRVLVLKQLEGVNEEDISLLLGKHEKPKLFLEDVLRDYFEFERPNLLKKSQDQIRKWKNPRKKAIRNFIAICGNVSVSEIERSHIVSFRSWWADRIEGEGLNAKSANKELMHLKRILGFAKDHYDLDIEIDKLFASTRFMQLESRRKPFETNYISNVLLKPRSLKNLHEEAKWLIYAMADTGARPGELLGLRAENGDIRLDTDIPYIDLNDQFRTLKTKQSIRKIPLVGASLYAFQNLPGGFRHYREKHDNASAAISSFLHDNNLLPSSDHTLYSLRHSFEDRLTEVEPPDKVQAALMGHKYTRERYGNGPSLELKKRWLDRIAFDIQKILK